MYYPLTVRLNLSHLTAVYAQNKCKDMTFLYALRKKSHSEYSTAETGAPDGKRCSNPTFGESFEQFFFLFFRFP